MRLIEVIIDFIPLVLDITDNVVIMVDAVSEGKEFVEKLLN